jgi:hypothetical protein
LLQGIVQPLAVVVHHGFGHGPSAGDLVEQVVVLQKPG